MAYYNNQPFSKEKKIAAIPNNKEARNQQLKGTRECVE